MGEIFITSDIWGISSAYKSDGKAASGPTPVLAKQSTCNRRSSTVDLRRQGLTVELPGLMKAEICRVYLKHIGSLVEPDSYLRIEEEWEQGPQNTLFEIQSSLLIVQISLNMVCADNPDDEGRKTELTTLLAHGVPNQIFCEVS